MILRKKTYLQWIEQAARELVSHQDTLGCFDYAYSSGKHKFANARYQEAILTLAWLTARKKQDYAKEVVAGMDFLSSLQNKDGSLPEIVPRERSFSASSFTPYAALVAMDLLGKTADYKPFFTRVAAWLMRNDEPIFTNQQAVAAVFLRFMADVYADDTYRLAAEKKLRIVLANQSSKGDYQEQKSLDFGYATLSFAMLARYYALEQRKDILSSAQRFIDLAQKVSPGNNVRGTNWAVLDGFEFFAPHLQGVQKAMTHVIASFDVHHLPNYRHVCTDAYRHCWSYDSVHAAFTHPPLRTSIPVPVEIGSRLLNPLRRFGLHKLRRYKYIFK